MTNKNLKEFLDDCHFLYNQKAFIEQDPISIPHSYNLLQDIEITAFWTSMFAWGLRKTIINKAKELFELMDNSPYDFIINHQEKDRKPFLNFKHRTFQPLDTLYFLDFFQQYYRQNDSLETAFSQFLKPTDLTVEKALRGFHDLFFSLPDAPQRTKKHISTPANASTCKRLNMFLRWMVRQDQQGVDFGIWQQIKPAQLLIPLDVHVDRVARGLGLINRTQTDWLTVLELSERLRFFDPDDPAKYDFALFGLGIEQKKMIP